MEGSEVIKIAVRVGGLSFLSLKSAYLYTESRVSSDEFGWLIIILTVINSFLTLHVFFFNGFPAMTSSHFSALW